MIALHVMAGWLVILPTVAYSQTPAPGPTSGPVLPDVIVTAERSHTELAKSAVSVTVLSGESLRAFPGRTLASALQQVPGFTIVDFAGQDDPQPIVRGFYGGGEADYVLLLIDGRPVNSLNNGRINWDLVPLAAIHSVEILRGSASALYGDAAVGAVINVRTLGNSAPSWSATLGDHGLAGASLSANVRQRADFYLDGFRHDGMRANAARRAYSVLGDANVLNHAGNRVNLSATAHSRAFDEPGPIVGSHRSGAEQSNIFFRLDRTFDRVHRLSLGVERGEQLRPWLTGEVGIDNRRADAIRTVPLAVTFADTKRRLLNSTMMHAVLRAETPPEIIVGRAVGGIELSAGKIRSEYESVVTGTAEDYRAANLDSRTPDSRGSGARNTASAFLQYEVGALERLRFVAGVRADHIRDDFRPFESAEVRQSHSAISPRFGATIGYGSAPGNRGHLYGTISHSFKAPTLDQLFDQRTIPVPFPPFAITLSNSDLIPQRANSAEAGVRHWISLAGGVLDISSAVYSIQMSNELDFSVEQLRFVNIGKSRHRGVESGVTLSAGGSTVFLNHSLDETKSIAGSNNGKRIKALPHATFRGGLSFLLADYQFAATATSVGEGYLDDANTRILPGYERMDLRLGRTFAHLNVGLEIQNLFNRKYSSTGFLDPAGSGATFFYPTPGRTLRLVVKNP